MKNVHPIFLPVLAHLSGQIECPNCGGLGRIDVDGQMRWGVYEKWIECPTCDGEGVVTPDPIETEDE